MRLVIAGFGNVGVAFSKLVSENAGWLRTEYGLVPRIVAIVDSKGAAVNPDGLRFQEVVAARAKGSVSNHPTFGRRAATVADVLKDLEADVLLEFTPTNLKTGQPGLDHIETAMNMGLNVVTTNKGPLALAMPALLELARYKDVGFMFSGTVGGGTPILQLAKECLAANRILAVEGVLNGTTNYILTKMHDGINFRDALRDAQRLGYAEADPSMDLGGFDTAAKLVILSNWAIGRKLSIQDVTINGISEVTADTIDAAKRSGGAMKLVGCASEGEASVKPQIIPSTSPLCVSGALNAVSLKTEFAGTITLVGYGSGGTETAAAALRDLIGIKQALLGSDIT